MKLNNLVILFSFAIFQTAFLMNLRNVGPDWTQSLSLVMVAVFVVSLVLSLWNSGVNKWFALVTIGFLALIIGATEAQTTDMETLEFSTFMLHIGAVVAVTIFYYLTFKPIKGLDDKIKLFSTASLFVNEAALVLYIATDENLAVFWVLVLATVSLGISFVLILNSITKI